MNQQSITLGGGCFWCVEAVFELVDGVLAVESGYANGHVSSPQLRAGLQRRHRSRGGGERSASTPTASACAKVLEIFFTVHDPTTLNRQGNDIGTQYRSGIYWTDPAHEAVAREVRAEADAAHRGRVVTEVLALDNYWRAEDYHQHYFANHHQPGLLRLRGGAQGGEVPQDLPLARARGGLSQASSFSTAARGFQRPFHREQVRAFDPRQPVVHQPPRGRQAHLPALGRLRAGQVGTPGSAAGAAAAGCPGGGAGCCTGGSPPRA